MTSLPAFVFRGSAAPNPVLVARTARGLARLGIHEIASLSVPEPGSRIAGASWWIRAGTWPVAEGPVLAPAPSSTGRPLVALGRTKRPEDAPSAEDPWEDLLSRTGGDFEAHLRRGGALPEVDSACLAPEVADVVTRHLRDGQPWSAALRTAIQITHARVVRIGTFDVQGGARLRVAQIVTSLQQGGAERLAIDLATSLPRLSVTTKLFVLGSPSRKTFAAPPGTVDLSRARGPWGERLKILRHHLSAWGADVVHAHLLGLADMRDLAEGGYPPLVTVHNMRPGWPPDLASIDEKSASLLVGCARAVEDDLRAAGIAAPRRTVWNGIDLATSRLAPEQALSARTELRRSLGIGDGDVVLLAAANPRPQKRLHLLPPILSVVADRLRSQTDPRDVWLLVAGDKDPVSPAARQALSELLTRIDRCPEGARIRLLGSVDPVTPLLAACDAMVSPSAHEGLSLAHLEALSAGKPVIASGTGGTAEVGRLTGALTFVDGDDPSDFATAILRALAAQDKTGPEVVERHFTTPRMVEGYARLYPRAAARAASPSPGKGLFLITNNLSTGGAQSSARRLLAGLANKGVPVRAAVLEEQPDYPTPGRRDLLERGIFVLTFAPHERKSPEAAVHRILRQIDEDPPAAVIFWNAIAAHKVLLAEALFDLPVFDVSPGEMYFTSLHRYFDSARPGVPVLSPRDYGSRLAGAIVKYEAERDLAARTLGAPVHVIANGVPLPEPVPVRDSPRRALGTTVRVHPHKKLEELLSALRLLVEKHPNVTLHIAGGPDFGQEAYLESLKQATSDLPVEWHGEVADVASFLRGLDIFALVAEPAGCPNSSLEALAAGLPVVATDVGGMRDQIEPEKSGLLVPRADPPALARALERVCSDKALRERLSAGARERIRERFSIERMISDYERVCRL
ncbi:MAG: glycosyltransferase family 4 protein [Polyangiaceae bacterium]